MVDLILTGIIMCVFASINALIHAVFLSSNMGDFWPIFQKSFVVNSCFFLLLDWIQNYLKKDLKQ